MSSSSFTQPQVSSFPSESTRPWLQRAGWVVSALPALALLLSAVAKLSHAQAIVDNMHTFGYPEGVLVGIGVVELASALLYVIPNTAVLGAVLATGYLGGAIATHVRVEQPFLIPLVLGVLAWAGLFLRDKRVRDLLLLRR